MASGPVSRWATDIGLAVGLVAALVGVAAMEPKPRPPAPPAELPVAVSTTAEIPPLPPLEVSFLTALADKEPPPLPPPPPPPPPPAAPPPPKPFEDAIDATKIFHLGFGRRTEFGIVRTGSTPQENKRLTFNEFGETNHTAVSVDTNVVPFSSASGKMIQRLVSIGKGDDSPTSDKVKGAESIPTNRLGPNGPYVVKWEYGGVLFEQWTNVEAGAVSRKMDTFRVRYTLTNTDSRPHTAGVRVMIDTFIGTNDGVPFFIPGRSQVVDKPLELTGKEVPDTILALERNDLSDPTMTVVQIGLTPPQEGPGERPGMVALTRWPGAGKSATPLAGLDRRWAVPLTATFQNDSAVVLAYQPAKLEPGGTRVFEFTYGLGSLSARSPELSLSPYGPFAPGKPFRVSAFVKNPKEGQNVTLAVPDGLELAKGEPAEKPVPVQEGVAVVNVDWLVTPSADFGGQAQLAATLTGAAKPETTTIFVTNPKPALQGVVVTGTPVAGGLVRVTAAVYNAKADTAAVLTLPANVVLEAGTGATQQLTPGAVAQATWLVRLPPDAAGELPVSVKLTNSTSAAAGVIRVQPTVPKLAPLRVDGLQQAGGVLRVTALVANAAAGGSVELHLPAGLVLAPNQKAVQPTPAGRAAQLSWLVRVNTGRVGPATLTATLAPNGGEETTTLDLAAAKPLLVARPATDAAATPSKAFWVVARVFHPPAGPKATLTLPAGMSFAGGAAAEAAMTAKTADGVPYAEAAWPVTLDAYTGPTVGLKVAVPGVGTEAVEVKCERGSVIR